MSVRRVVITDDETPAVDAPRGRDNRRGHRFVWDTSQPSFGAGEDLVPYGERRPREQRSNTIAPWISRARSEFEQARKGGKVTVSEALFERAIAGTPRR